MRLAILSDIHGNLTALEATLADLEAAGGADVYWCLGDLAAFGPRPAACIRRIRELVEQHGEQTFKVIGGNTDRYLVTGERFPSAPAQNAEELAAAIQRWKAAGTILNWNAEQLSFDDYGYLAKILGKELDLKVDGYGWVIGFHAVPGDDEAFLTADTPGEQARDYLLDRAGRLAIGGHTHIQMDRDLGNWHVLNPGSVGSAKDEPGKAGWALLTFEEGEVTVDLRRVPYDVDAAIADLETVGYPVPEFIVNQWR